MSDTTPSPTPSDPELDAGEDAPQHTRDALWARRLHDHTHEVELIISAALVFGLFQSLPVLDGWFDRVSPTMAGAGWTAAFVAWYYGKLIVYTLILAFGAHLAARGYWVGLVGLDSVFPDGVDWDRMSYGPWTIRTYRERARPLASMARQADRVASAIFSLAFLLVYLFVLSVVVGAVMGLVAVLLRPLLPALDSTALWLGMVAALGAAPVLATTLDRVLGGRLGEDALPTRVIRAVLGGFYRFSGGAFFLPIQFVLFTRVPKRVIWPLYTGVFVLLLTIFIGGELVRSGTLVPSAHEVLPSRPGPRSVDGRYFAETRPEASTAPYIQAEVIQGPYVRLELPLVARREQDRLEARCGDEPVLGGRGLVRSRTRAEPADAEATGQVLACIAGLWEVRLNGRALNVDWDFRSHPGRGVTGLVAYLPTAGLAPGAQLLEIHAVPVPSTEDGAAAAQGEEDGEEGHHHHMIRFRI